MKKKVKSINLKQATIIMTNISNSLQPVEAAYRTPTELFNINGVDKSLGQKFDLTDIWFKAIYGKPLFHWDDNKKDDIPDKQFLQELWNKTGYKGDIEWDLTKWNGKGKLYKIKRDNLKPTKLFVYKKLLVINNLNVCVF